MTLAYLCSRVWTPCRLLPLLPVDEAPEVLRSMSEAFASIQVPGPYKTSCLVNSLPTDTRSLSLLNLSHQAYQNRLEMAYAQADKRYHAEAQLRQQETDKQLRRWVG